MNIFLFADDTKIVGSVNLQPILQTDILHSKIFSNCNFMKFYLMTFSLQDSADQELTFKHKKCLKTTQELLAQ